MSTSLTWAVAHRHELDESSEAKQNAIAVGGGGMPITAEYAHYYVSADSCQRVSEQGNASDEEDEVRWQSRLFTSAAAGQVVILIFLSSSNLAL